jgi:hypothetical protein
MPKHFHPKNFINFRIRANTINQHPLHYLLILNNHPISIIRGQTIPYHIQSSANPLHVHFTTHKFTQSSLPPNLHPLLLPLLLPFFILFFSQHIIQPCRQNSILFSHNHPSSSHHHFLLILFILTFFFALSTSFPRL